MDNNFDKLIHHDPYELVINGQKIIVHDGVFAPDPDISNSTSLILNNLPDLSGKDVLDIGTGTGVIAIVCASRDAKKVVATDISDKAIANTKENVERTSCEIELVKSDLYHNIEGNFDYVFANLPIDNEIWGLEENTTSVVERFLDESVSHLKDGGKIYLPWFSIVDVKQIKDLTDKFGYSYDIVTEEKFGFTWYLFILSSTSND